jgi:hypothetical protein
MSYDRMLELQPVAQNVPMSQGDRAITGPKSIPIKIVGTDDTNVTNADNPMRNSRIADTGVMKQRLCRKARSFIANESL